MRNAYSPLRRRACAPKTPWSSPGRCSCTVRRTRDGMRISLRACRSRSSGLWCAATISALLLNGILLFNLIVVDNLQSRSIGRRQCPFLGIKVQRSCFLIILVFFVLVGR